MTYSFQRGFSLVEVLVAVSILLIVISGPITIMTQTARSSTYANEQVVAFFLAQEGLELVQKIRDDQYVDYFDNPSAPGPGRWQSFLSSINACINPTGCGVEIADDAAGSVSVSNCTGADPCRLYYSTSPNQRSRYTYTTTASSTPFTRRIDVEAVDFDSDGAVDYIEVVSEVTWFSGSIASLQRTQAVTYLSNIYDID